MIVGLIKILLCVFNVLCSLVGVSLITVSSIILVRLKDLHKVTSGSTDNDIPIVFITLGCIIFVISFLGCCGIYRRSKFMLCAYGICLLVIFVLQIALAIYQATNASSKTNWKKFQDEIEKAFERYDEDETVRQVFHAFEFNLRCCGLKGDSDYEKYPKWKYPASCCGHYQSDKECTATKFTEGCMDKLNDLIEALQKMCSTVVLVVSLVEVVGAVFAFCLVRSYKREERRIREGG